MKEYEYFKKYTTIANIIKWGLAILIGVIFLVFEIGEIFTTEDYSMIANASDFLRFFFIVVAVLLLTQIIANVIMAKKYDSTVISLLHDRCDPRLFSDAQLQFIQSKTPAASNLLYRSNYALGLWLCGEYEKASKLYNEIIYSKQYELLNPMLQLLILANKLSLELDTYGNVTEVKSMMPRVYMLFGRVLKKSKGYDTIKEQVENLAADIELAEGRVPADYESRYISILEAANNNFKKASCKYPLMVYYRTVGNTEKYLSLANEIMENYSKLFYASKAKQMLTADGLI
ncbi:MAG: hypothetical protein IKA82_01465 [Clostridia bacterium]|nr:hypothetical protein [Clostridia bacterium]